MIVAICVFMITRCVTAGRGYAYRRAQAKHVWTLNYQSRVELLRRRPMKMYICMMYVSIARALSETSAWKYVDTIGKEQKPNA